MARPTIASLTAQVASLTEQLATACAERDRELGAHQQTLARLAALEATRSPADRATKPAKPAFVPRPPSAEVLARREAMAAAKAEALATGRSTVASFK